MDHSNVKRHTPLVFMYSLDQLMLIFLIALTQALVFNILQLPTRTRNNKERFYIVRSDTTTPIGSAHSL